tara:strand:- start:1814 stop:2251 length:438 start_codon:yes stop_codon:yes gene_type:complete
MNESQLWSKINLFQKPKKMWHFCRIESATIRGIPDVNCLIEGKEFWLELKANQVKNYGVSNFQINWHLKRQKCGGKVFVLHSCTKQRELKLLRVQNHISSNHIRNHITSNHILEPRFEILASISFNQKTIASSISELFKALLKNL